MKRILFVDDIPQIRRMAAELIKQRGHQLQLFEDGQQALEEIAAGAEFDVLITDQNMPLLHGSGLITRLRQQGFRQPMYVYSSVPSSVPRDCECDGIYDKSQLSLLLDEIGD